MSDLHLLHESVVEASQIDSLGHMNVRFYVERAATAHGNLLKQLGVKVTDNQVIRRVDTYNRFHREQFEGATLQTFGGLVSTETNDGLTGYYEIRNSAENSVAATFIMTSKRFDIDSQVSIPIDAEELLEPDQYAVEVPDHGRPRSLSLEPPQTPKMEEIEPLIPGVDLPGSMSGKREGVVTAEDCDAEGRLREETDPMFVLFRPQPGEELRDMGPPLLRDELGRRYSWAMMEIRTINFARPMQDDVIVSLSADVNYGDKWRHTRRWIYQKSTRELLGISDHAAVCMDLDARKAISIPSELRPVIEAQCLRHFA